jgi:APA family basic amino acid/polyamine antiporter
MLAAWLLGGLFCLAGALTYTELAAAYPRVGGEYVYLDRAFGGAVSFLFVWARMTVIQTGTIAATAYVFGDYMARLVPEARAGPLVWALTATVVLTITNLVGLKTGKWAQNVLTVAKVVGVVAIAVVGLAFAPAEVPLEAAPAAAGDGPGLAGFGLAMILILYTFGGWNEAAYVAGELKDEKRNALRLLVGSILLITVVYVVVNLAYVRVLGMATMGRSEAVAADAMERTLGAWGSVPVSVLVALSALGAMNGCIFTGARSICGLGEDYRLFAPLGRWSRRFGTPAAAILVQSAIAVVLIILPGLGGGFEEALGSGFRAAVDYTMPVFWAFFLLTGIAVFVLRVKEPEVERPFRVPLYLVPAVVFCLMCAYMLYSSVAYTRIGALVGVAVLLVGVPVYLLCRRMAGAVHG